MTQSGLIGAVLYAKDWHRLVEFYSALTGLQVRTMQEGFAVLGGESSQLSIVRIPKQIADTINIAMPPARREDTPIKLAFGVVDIAVARTIATRHGGAVNPIEREWEFEGARVCDGHDPEGNVFQLRHMG